MSKKSAALGSVKLSLDISDQYGRDASAGIVTDPKATYQETTIEANSETGRYEKTESDIQNPVRKDVDKRQDELDFYKGQVSALQDVCEVADKKVFDAVTEINSKKNQIIQIVTEATAISCGCSSTSPVSSVVNGVTLGVGRTFVEDYAFIKTYGGMDSNSDNPYESIDESTMTQNNIGTGFESGYTANYVEESGDPTTGTPIYGYRTLTGLAIPFNFAGNCDDDDCAAKLAQIQAIATEIDTLRSGIDGQLITDTNTVKEEKSKNQLFVWSYEHTEKSTANTKQKTENVQNVIENQSGFEG
jgi:hypothetical protein|tara:strand:- start:444 stop:1349 length:906 start_codon:yes stop_codon:yes gene_type:complete